MQGTGKSAAGPVLGLVIVFTALLAIGTPQAIELPTETAVWRESGLPGYRLATQKCVVCHSADYIRYQPPDLNQAQWTAEVAKMKHAYGAQLSDKEIGSIGAYLAVAYGSARATDASVQSVSATPAPSTNNAIGSAGNVQSLLNRNGCLGCHAINTKRIGPAFSEVAIRYKGNVGAQTLISTSIRQGSTGKWGQVPMPSMTGLSDAQVKAVAAFILEQ